MREVPHLLPLPAAERVEAFLREERRVGRDGFVAWERGWYGVPWPWAGQRVQIAATESLVELWAGNTRLAVHPRATRPGQRLVFNTPFPGAKLGSRSSALTVHDPAAHTVLADTKLAADVADRRPGLHAICAVETLAERF